MEPEGSLPYSQQRANCPYPEPDQTSLCSPIPLPEDQFSYYPTTFSWVFKVVYFPQVSPQKLYMLLSFPS